MVRYASGFNCHGKQALTSHVGLKFTQMNFHPEEDSSWEVRYRVLFSSADSFTGYCERQAERHDDVVLICGIKAGLFML